MQDEFRELPNKKLTVTFATPVPVPDTRPLFRPLVSQFLALLRWLPDDAWARPATGRWQVRDVVAHMLDTAIRRLSFHRDGVMPPPPERPWADEREFVAFINQTNAQWVDVARRISPRVLTDLYDLAGHQLADFMEAFPEHGKALFPVSWAGDDDSSGLFDVGREFTEVWHHHMQVRRAVGAQTMGEVAWLHAVLLLALRALPHAYRDVQASDGTLIALDVTGDAGGKWMLRHSDGRWGVLRGDAMPCAARVTMSDDTAWQLLFNGLARDEAGPLVSISGDRALAAPLLDARAVIV